MLPKRRAAPARSTPSRTVFAVVAIVAAATNLLSFLAAQLWVYPDSIDYIQLAGGIADRLDFTHELFLVRTPGYPLFLACLFALFGTHSPTALLVIQHPMAAAVAVLTAAIAWRITNHRVIALLAGVLCACSLQILAYANMVLTEIPFTLTLALCLYALIRFQAEDRLRWLATASLLAGIGYLLRPVCLYLLPLCAMAGLWHAWAALGVRDRLRRAVAAVPCSLIPALLVAAPWMVLSAASHRSLQATRCLDYVLYLRAATFDGLDSRQSPAMRDIHAVIAEARAIGALSPDADYRDRATVIKAYQEARELPFSESSAILGRAGRDLMREHPWEIFVGTFRYAAWMLLSPDPVYRFHPGGVSGMDGRRAPHAEIYDAGTYSLGPGSWEPALRQYEHHLPLRNTPTLLSSTAMQGASFFHRNVEQGRVPGGFVDSPYELWILVGLAGGAMSLVLFRNGFSLWAFGILALHVLVSAFLSGPQTRYAVPVKPILCIYSAIALAAVGERVLTWSRAAVRRLGSWTAARAPQTRVAMAVLMIAAAVELLAMSASHLWIVPTSVEYLELAKEIAERGDLTNELFLLRTPGYPLMMAAVFGLFGSHSATALFVLQHGMTILISPLIALTAWQITLRKDVSFLAGILAACSLQVIAFASQVMTETPYTLALVAAVYGVVRYQRGGSLRVLAAASLLAGIAYLMRPMGLTLICVLSAVAFARVWEERRFRRATRGTAIAASRGRLGEERSRSWIGAMFSAQTAAWLPMVAVVLPWWVHNHVTHGANSVTRCFDFALYNRAANVERASGTTNEQIAEIQTVVAQAKTSGRLADGADAGLAWTVWQAYRAVNGATLTQTSETIGHAARDKLLRDPLSILWGTARYSAWMMLMPDSSYRYHPDGERGVAGRRPPDAGLFDSAMYLQPLATALQPYASYVRLEHGTTATTPLWSGINEWFLRRIERGGPLLGVADSLYEEFILACVACGLLALFTRDGRSWLIVGGVVVLQIVPSAFVAGIGPRYAVPIQPFMKLYAAFAIVLFVRVVVRAICSLRATLARTGEQTAWS